MAIDNQTEYLALPLPHSDNQLNYDVERLIDALEAIDANAEEVDNALAEKQASTSATSAIAALTPAADKIPYFTNGTTAALATLSSWIRTNLLPAATASAARSALELAAVANSGSYNDLGDKPTIPTLPASTDALSEGSSNLYHTVARVRATVLTGLSTAAATTVAATHTILEAIGFLQAQLTAHALRLVPTGGTDGQAVIKSGGSIAWGDVSTRTDNVNNLGNKAVSGSETVNLDCSVDNWWSVSLGSSDAAGTLTINITNLPDTTTKVYAGHVRLIRGARKTIAFTVPAGKTFNWIQGAAPSYASATSDYDVIMFYIMLNEAKIHAMVTDTGTV